MVNLTKEEKSKIRAEYEKLLSSVRAEMIKLIKSAGRLTYKGGHADGIWAMDYQADGRVKLDGYAAEAYAQGNWDWRAEYIVNLEDLVFADISLLANQAANKMAHEKVMMG